MKLTCLIPILIFSIGLNAQHLNDKNIEDLLQLQSKIKVENELKNQRVKKYLASLPITKAQDVKNLFDQGYELLDVQNGHPLFRKSFNSDASLAMEVNAVRPGGELGLLLEGAGMNIGIWDGGLIRTLHQDFNGRIKYFDGAVATSFSNHSTGVAGTLLGDGANASAKGMAPKAEGVAYDFNNDTGEMVTAQMLREIVVSNHSYGLITGWDDGQWYGNSSISNDEDWRFGFYDGNARTWDEIAIASPKYLIVKSAGNDRGDSGNGAHPSDGPYDTVAGASTSKNILVVGAVKKSSTGYDNPLTIEMSSFSGWGPTDDGRIKPDVVSIGVDIITAGGQSDANYQTTSGTSFSSPAACGGLALVQELSKKLSNTFLWASSVKGLAIHTVKQTGAKGPDYRNGWGLLNIKKACQYLLDRNGTDKRLLEESLSNNEIKSFQIVPKANTKIRITLSWTDPAGSPVASSLDPTNLMLVNDLDIRLTDENGTSYLPYILNPANPSANATTGDNFRDNVEQIYLDNAEERTYTLNLSHKGELRNGSQNYSLIIDYESTTSSLTNIFWINGSGSWSDATHWSLTSGGQPANEIPSSRHRVIFDDNSLMGNDFIEMDVDFEIGAISSFTTKDYVVDLNENNLIIAGSTSLSSSKLTLANGSLTHRSFESGTQNINLNNTKTENLDIIIPEDNLGHWVLQNSNIQIDDFILEGGSLTFDDIVIDLKGFRAGHTNAETTFNFLDSELTATDALEIFDLSILNSNRNSTIQVEGRLDGFQLNVGNRELNVPVFINNSSVVLTSDQSRFKVLTAVNSQISLIGNVTATELKLVSGGALNFENGTSMMIIEKLEIDNDASNRTSITGNNSVSALIDIEFREKLCFDNLDLKNVNLTGASSVSVGLNSTLDSSEGWVEIECGNLLFSDFQTKYLCAKGISEFIDLSQGQVNAWEWSIDNSFVSDEATVDYSFETPGMHSVSLLVFDQGGNSSIYSKDIEIINSPLDANVIIEVNATTLASLKLADSYQWYKNDEPVAGETSRTYVYGGEEAKYFVVTFKGDCNRKSEILDFTSSVHDFEFQLTDFVRFSPNPALDHLNLDIKLTKTGQATIFDFLGREVMNFKLEPFERTRKLDLSGISAGVYVFRLFLEGKYYSSKFVIH